MADMTTSIMKVQPRTSLEFAENSVLEVVVPASPDINIEDELRSWDGVENNDSTSVMPFLSQRQVILLDELLSIYVVFRTRPLDDDILKSYLARLTVSIDTYAFSTAPAPEAGPNNTPKETIHSSTIKYSDDPTICHHGSGDESHIFIIQKVDVFMRRPEGRFHKPAIYFQPSASFKPANKPQTRYLEDEYLPSRTSVALNLLQAFERDPAMAGVHPRLSAARIHKISLNAPVAREIARPIRNGQQILYRILSPLVWRVRYSNVTRPLKDLSLIASLDLEVTQSASYAVKINEISLQLHEGHVVSLTNELDTHRIYQPGDQLTHLYKINPNLSSDGTPFLGSKGHFLILNISAQVIMSRHCKPDISIGWRTHVEFTNDRNMGMIKAAQRASRYILPHVQAPKPDAFSIHDSSNRQEYDDLENMINVTLTISGPPEVVVGELFSWDMFMINRSDKIRRPAVLVIPKGKRETENKPLPSTSSAGVQNQVVDKKSLLAHAVIDENIIYGRQKKAKLETTELICLTTDIRLGQLPPGACCTASLKFLALSAGVPSIEALRIFDLLTNEVVDIHDLPSIVAVERHLG